MRLAYIAPFLILLLLVSPAFAAVNLMPNSQYYSTGWTGTGYLLTNNVTTAYDGSNLAWNIKEISTTAHQIYQGVTVTANTNYTWSMYVKQNASSATRYVQFPLGSSTFGTTNYTNFDTQTCTVSRSSTNPITSAATADGGWCRFSVTSKTIAAGTANLGLALIRSPEDSRAPAYTATSGNTTFIYGAQLETGDTLTTYNATNWYTTFAMNVSTDNNSPNLAVQFNDTVETPASTAWNWSFIDYGNETLVLTKFSTARNATQLFGAGNFSVNLTANGAGADRDFGYKWINISAGTIGTGWRINGTKVYPDDHIFQTNISALPTLAMSSVYVNNFSDAADPYLYTLRTKIVTIADANITKTAPIRVGYPTSTGTTFPITDYYATETGAGSDRGFHILGLEDHTYYATYYNTTIPGRHPNGTYEFTSTVVIPPNYYTFTLDGARIDPPLLRYDEAVDGDIKHMVGVSINNTRNTFVWPSNHQSGGISSNTSYIPIGTVFRLKPDFDASGYTPIQQHILNGLKTYGMMVMDNAGKVGYFVISTEASDSWGINYTTFSDPTTGVHSNDFEAVNVSSLMVDEDSGKALGGTPPVTPTITSTISNPSIFNWYCPAGRFCLGPFILWDTAPFFPT